jgi:hypothetical protein
LCAASGRRIGTKRREVPSEVEHEVRRRGSPWCVGAYIGGDEQLDGLRAGVPPRTPNAPAAPVAEPTLGAVTPMGASAKSSGSPLGPKLRVPNVLLRSLLREPATALAYPACARVEALRPGTHIPETKGDLFDPSALAEAGGCVLTPSDELAAPFAHAWPGHWEPVVRTLATSWGAVTWRGEQLEVVRVVDPSLHHETCESHLRC